VPEPASGLEDEGVPDFGDALDSKEVTGDAQEGYELPRDRTLGVDDFGTTPFEEAMGESLDGRLAREEPDVLSPEYVETDADADAPYGDEPFLAGQPGLDVGRLVESDEGARPDTEAELTAYSAGTDRGGFTAEEAAMHLDPDS